MPKLSDLDSDIKKYGGSTGSDRFEFNKGVNKIRVLNFPAIIATHFWGPGVPAVICVGIDEGCPYHGDNAPKDEKTGNEKSPSLKLVTYIVDRKDGKVKLAELPLSVRYALRDLQETEGFDFEDFPMPYDIQVMHDPDNKDPKAKYRVTGIPKMTPLSPEEARAFEDEMARMSPEQYVEKRKAKQKGNASFDQAGGSSQEDPQEPGPIEDSYPEGPDPRDIPF